jgi:hypothetical protein
MVDGQDRLTMGVQRSTFKDVVVGADVITSHHNHFLGTTWRFPSVNAQHHAVAWLHTASLLSNLSFSTDVPPDENPFHPIQSPNRAQPHQIFLL